MRVCLIQLRQCSMVRVRKRSAVSSSGLSSGLAVGQREVTRAAQHERRAVLHPGQRHVRRQAERVRRVPAGPRGGGCRARCSPDVGRSHRAACRRRGRAVQLERADDPIERRGAEAALVLPEAGREVEQLEAAVLAAEGRAKDVRVVDVGLLDALPRRASRCGSCCPARDEKAAEHKGAVKRGEQSHSTAPSRSSALYAQIPE